MNNVIEIKQIDRGTINYLVRNLDDFGKDKAIKKGLGDAGKVFEKGGKGRLKRSMKSGSRGVTGNLLRSFNVRVKKSKPGVLVGFKQGKDGGSHAHLVDMGTTDRYWKTKSHKYVGKVKANHFWTDTEEQDYPKALETLYDGIERAVNRINNRQ
ncbi:hypothetical protein [Dysgonomonas sp. GY617]|uniref:hypothetical protein n=1 Tax=Dysgonomonas sp. GY617 TaxID=2780420 RepID=UPI0018831B87|nr:hypothetical protein [Dysgonomonas sp. GY617]MBF0577737.1 hypothetical protein [Dysgonomonas sp. GY617]